MPEKPSFAILKTSKGLKIGIPAFVTASKKRGRSFFPARQKAEEARKTLRFGPNCSRHCRNGSPTNDR